MEMKLPPVHEMLAHLTEEQLEDLCKRFPHEKNQILIDEFGLNVSVAWLPKIVPPRVTHDLQCPHCKVSLWQKVVKIKKEESEIPYCPVCDHKIDSFCMCKYCEDERRFHPEKARLRSVGLGYRKYKREKTINQVNELPLLDQLYLSAFLRVATKDNSNLLSLLNSSLKLSPNRYCDSLIIVHLLNNSYLKQSSEYPYECPIELSDSNKERFNFSTDFFITNINPGNQDVGELMMKLYYPEINKVTELELRDIWKMITKAECLEYVIHTLQELKISYKYSKRHEELIEKILHHFPVSQFYSLYGSAIKAAVYKKEQGKIELHQVLNVSMNQLENYLERAIKERWNVTKCNRRYWSSQSVISEVFFNYFLKIGNSGFWECPHTFEIDVDIDASKDETNI